MTGPNCHRDGVVGICDNPVFGEGDVMDFEAV